MVDDLDLAWEEQYRSHRGQPGRRPPRNQPSRGRSKRDRGRGKRSFGALFVSFLLLVGLGAGVYWGVGKVQDFFSADDYTSTGTETVTIEVKDGQSLTDIGNTLFTAGVVKSSKAFINAADADPRSRNIQVGFYKLYKQMPAKDALAMLLDPDKSRVVNGVTIPEGLMTTEIYAKLSKELDIPVKDFVAAAKSPSKLGVDASWYVRTDKKKSAKGVEGFLFPATYEFPPDASASDVLKIMIAKFNDVAEELGFVDTVNENLGGVSPYEALIAASIVQSEAKLPEDFGKVARVLYNRAYSRDFVCDCLEVDAAINYWIKLQGKDSKDSSEILQSELDNPDNPYNTHLNPGMPVGPISSPGEAALKAAMQPTKGNWLFFVTVNKEGAMAYAVNNDEHEANIRKACDAGVLTGAPCGQ
jgi:UPF0755 protein